MKKLLAYSLVAIMGTTALTGCGTEAERKREAEHIRQLECLEATGDRFCRGEGELEILEEREENRYKYSRESIVYGPTAPGTYNNYYGNEQYGYWGNNGQFMFNDPYSSQASSTNSFLLGAGLGGLAAYALTRDSWNQENPKGWTEKTYETKQPLSKNGKVISQAEYDKRAAQSKKDKAKHQAKLKADNKAAKDKANKAAGLKKKQEATNAKKAANKPTKAQNDAKKAELKAKLAARKAAKDKGTATTGSKLKQNEQKVQQKSSNDALKAKLKAKRDAKTNKPGISSGQKMRNNEKKAQIKKARADRSKNNANKPSYKAPSRPASRR